MSLADTLTQGNTNLADATFHHVAVLSHPPDDPVPTSLCFFVTNLSFLRFIVQKQLLSQIFDVDSHLLLQQSCHYLHGLRGAHFLWDRILT